MRRATLLLIASLVILAIYWLYVTIYPTSDPVPAIYVWLRDISIAMGYLGTFLMSFLGNATVLVPFPYVGLPYILGGLVDETTQRALFDPLMIGVFSGLGATLGEMTGYILGRLGGEFVDRYQTSAFRSVIERHPRLAPLVLFVLAVTPIPDDILVVPLGVSKYPFWRVFVPQLLGKTIFLTAIAWAGRLSLSWVEEIVLTSDTPGVIARTLEVLGLMIVIVILYLILTYRWRESEPESNTV